MNIILTGAAGFIGYHLALELLKKKHKVLGIDNFNNYYSKSYKRSRVQKLIKNKNFIFYNLDLKKIDKFKKKLIKFKPSAIYHLASQPGIMYSFKNPESYIKNNITVTKKLINCTSYLNIKKFYFTSSSSVYGNTKKFPISENTPKKPLNLYAKTKLECEKILCKSFKKKKIDLKIFRPFTVYGPYSRPDMLFISYLNSVYQNKYYTLYNNGNYIRDFTYVVDVAKILTKFLNIPEQKRNIFNICSSKPQKIIKIIKLIKKNNKKLINLKYKPIRKGEMIKTYGDNSRIKKLIKFKNFISIEKGIKNTVNWYKKFKNKDQLKFEKI